MNLFGNFTALVTPFNKNKSIDFISLEKLCNFQLNNFSDGIVALGSTAEATALEKYEKHKVMEKITQTTESKLPIIAGVNAFTLSDAIYQADARFLDGANALLIAPPPYIKPTEKGVFSFFSKIADHSYIPLILYNIPSRTGSKINDKVIIELSKHPNIIGLKDAGGDIIYTQNIISLTRQNDFSVLSGNDNQLLPILALGGTGIISVAGNIIPDILHRIISNFRCDIETSRELYLKFLPLINSLSLESNPIPIKFALSKLNLIKPYYREPLSQPQTINKKIISGLLST